MTPYEEVASTHNLPFPLYNYQVDTVNALANVKRAGYYLDVGTGKTMTSLVACCYKLRKKIVDHVLVIVPPVLMANWEKNIKALQRYDVSRYEAGTKTKNGVKTVNRNSIPLNIPFVIMSYQIFQRDFKKLKKFYANKNVALLCDEAQALKNIGSKNYECVMNFQGIERSPGKYSPEEDIHHILLLSGTPLSTPVDAYAYLTFTNPTAYVSYKRFTDLHVLEYDFFERPIKFDLLDELNAKLKVNSVRLLKEDVLKDLPSVIYSELPYDLVSEHLDLYNEIVDTEMVKLPDGEKIDLTQATKLMHALNQIPCNAEHFSGGEIKSTAHKILDSVMDELGDRKLVCFTYYKMTNRKMLEYGEKYGCVVLYGEMSSKEKDNAIKTFIENPACRLICLQISAGGAGIDGLQHVCSDVLFLELPSVPAHLHQAVARVHRQGQRLPVTVRVAIAQETLQVFTWDKVMERDAVVNLVIRNIGDLRDLLHGKRRLL